MRDTHRTKKKKGMKGGRIGRGYQEGREGRREEDWQRCVC